MDEESITNLWDALELTLSPDNVTRKKAEQFVYQSMKIAGFTSAMLHICSNSKYNEGKKVDVSQAASIQFKNMAEIHWRFKSEAHARDATVSGFRFIIIQQEDKQYVRDNILELILQWENETVVRQLNYAVECIARIDFPDKWPQLADQIQAYLNTEDDRKILIGLESLKSVCKRFEFEYDVGRIPLEKIVHNIFPRIEEIVGQIEANETLQAFDIKYRIADILYTVNQINIWERYKTVEGFEKLMEFYKFGLEWAIDPELLEKTEDTDTIIYRKKRPEWRFKSISMRFFFRIFQKYGNPELWSKEDKELSEHISKFIEFEWV
jgi:hypothetical protein